MNIEEIKRAAIYGEKLELLTIPEKQLYRQFEALYIAYIGARYTKESVKVERDIIISEYYEYVKQLQVLDEYQANIRKAGTIRSDIDKAKTPNEKLRLSLICIELMTGETGFAKRNMDALHQEYSDMFADVW